MDSATKKAQQMNEIWNIQKALSHSFNIISPNRFVRKTFHVTFMKVPCHLYIFNNLITINSYDRKSQTVLFSSRIINFLYFPSYDQIGIWMKKKLYLAVFESENDRAEFVSLVEDLRAQQSARNSVNLIFLWSNPFIPRTLPKLRFIDGVQINDTYLFFGENFLINCNFKLRKVSVSETPIGIRTGFAMAGNSTDKVYLVGGKNEEEYYDDVWLYEILYSTWTKLSEHEFPPRCEHSVIYDDRKLIIFGGRYKKQFYNDIHIFYPYTSTWEKYTDLNNTPIPRSLHSAVLIKRKMIIHGGHNSKTVFNDVCAFDIDKFQWDTTPEKVPLMINQSSIPKRYGHRTIALQNILINIGGTENGEEVQIPSVIFTNENNRCTIFDSGGNWPNSLESFALCFDYENRHLVIYSQCSIFSGLIPSEIENAYLDSLEQERTSYRFQIKRSEKRQSALLEEGELYQNCLARRRLQKCRHTKKETTTESTRKAINLLDFDLDHQLDVPNKNENPDSFNNPIKDNSKGFNSPEQNESHNNNANSQNNNNDIQNNNNDIQNNNNNDSQNNNNDSPNKNDRVSFSPSPFKVTFSPKIMPNTYTENFPSVGTPKNENSNGNNSIQLNCLARPRLAGRRYSKQERKFFTQFGSESSENSNQEINSPEIKRIDDLNEKPSLRQTAQIRSSLSQNTSQFMPNIKIDQKTDPSFQTKSSDNISQMREKNRLKFGKVDTRSPQKKPQINIDQTEINNQTNNSGTNK